MNAAVGVAVAMVRSWVALYTIGLPREPREARRSEIECDLWEQQWLAARRGDRPVGTAVEVLARMLLGVISDITWRAEAGASARAADRSVNVNESLTMRGLLVLALAVAAFPAVIGVLVAIGANGEMATSERLVWGPVQLLIGATIICGLVFSARRPGLGIGLVEAGTIAISVLWYWAAMFTVPIGIALAAVSYFRGRRSGWSRGAGNHPPAGAATA